MKVKYVKNVDTSVAEAKLYKLAESSTYRDWEDNEEVDKPMDYIVVSAANVPFSGPETYIFPGDENGIINFLELEGSFRGALNHEEALRRGGYEVDD